MKNVAYIAYNKRSCVSGKFLYNELLPSLKERGVDLRRIVDKEFKFNPAFLIRWGNSLVSPKNDTIELNRREAVTRATDKLTMIRILSSCEGVVTPEYSTSRPEDVAVDGFVFVRDHYDHTRYLPVEHAVRVGAKYYIKPINKQHEYRIHVFNGKCIGVYEKVPQDQNAVIFKNANCDFVRLNRKNKDVKKQIKGVQPMARKAVESLGLLFGGVDIITDSDRNIYVLEVNTAPSLNSINLERYRDAFIDYISDAILNPNSPNPAEIHHTETQPEVEARMIAENEQRKREIYKRLKNIARSAGFELSHARLDVADSIPA